MYREIVHRDCPPRYYVIIYDGVVGRHFNFLVGVEFSGRLIAEFRGHAFLIIISIFFSIQLFKFYLQI